MAAEVVLRKSRRLRAGWEGVLFGAFIIYPWLEFHIARISIRFLSALQSLVFFNAACPIFLHLLGRWHFERPHYPEADPLGIRVKPNALGQLRILHFPGSV